jgi:hypothetical protein
MQRQRLQLPAGTSPQTVPFPVVAAAVRECIDDGVVDDGGINLGAQVNAEATRIVAEELATGAKRVVVARYGILHAGKTLPDGPQQVNGHLEHYVTLEGGKVKIQSYRT